MLGISKIERVGPQRVSIPKRISGSKLRISFSDFFPKSKGENYKKTSALLARLLVEGSGTRQEIDTLVDTLASAGLQFDEKKLGGGPGIVLYQKGSPLLWSTTFNAGKGLNTDNQASQTFDPLGRTAVNRAEYFGENIWVSASGTYEPLDDSKVCPKEIKASIQEGKLSLFGFELPLPIKGTGVFEVMYCDDVLRVFRSGGSIAVQIKATAL